MDDNNAAERPNLPREEYELVVSRPVDLEFMGTEVILSVFDIEGDHEIGRASCRERVWYLV